MLYDNMSSIKNTKLVIGYWKLLVSQNVGFHYLHSIRRQLRKTELFRDEKSPVFTVQPNLL